MVSCSENGSSEA